MARLLKASPQTVKNWEGRGVSKRGAIDAQQAFGVNANWILENAGAMFVEGGPQPATKPSQGRSAESLWPLTRITQQEWQALESHERASVEGAMMAVLAQLRGEVPTPQRVAPGARHHMNTTEVPLPDHAAGSEEFGDVARYLIKFAAGTGVINFKVVEGGSLMFRREFLRQHGVTRENGAIVYASGFSMEPVIADGATMLLRREELSLDQIRPGAVYAFMRNGELLVKTIIKNVEDRWVGRSLNAAHPDVDLDGSESVRVFDLVVWAGARLVPDGGHQWMKRAAVLQISSGSSDSAPAI